NIFADGIGSGGAIENGAVLEFLPSTLTITDSTLTGNRAGGGDGDPDIDGGQAAGGAIANAFGANAQVIHSTLSDNVAQGGKGGGGPGDIGNSQALGGALFNAFAGATLVVSDSTFKHNQSIGGDGGVGANGGTGKGGALIANRGSMTTITGSIFIDNQAIGGK